MSATPSERVLVITGASDGMGAELARQLASDRFCLALAARTADKLEAVAAQCQARGARTLVVPTDVAIETECRALIDRAAAEFGRIDGLILNAGVSMHARLADIEDTSVYERLMRINLMGAVWPTHAALSHLKASRGQIVAVSSLAGLVGVPERTTYCATKFAMTGFFEALRVELAPEGVSVMIAYPGVVATEIRRNGWNAHGERAGVSGLDEGGPDAGRGLRTPDRRRHGQAKARRGHDDQGQGRALAQAHRPGARGPACEEGAGARAALTQRLVQPSSDADARLKPPDADSAR